MPTRAARGWAAACDGVVPLSHTFDSVGVLCRSAADATLIDEVLDAERIARGAGGSSVAQSCA
eukprot:1493180-Prymnesium_polylepis.1